MPQIHRHSQGFVSVAFDIFKLAFAHRNAQTVAFGNIHACIRRTQSFGVLQGEIGQFFKLRAAVAETMRRI